MDFVGIALGFLLYLEDYPEDEGWRFYFENAKTEEKKKEPKKSQLAE